MSVEIEIHVDGRKPARKTVVSIGEARLQSEKLRERKDIYEVKIFVDSKLTDVWSRDWNQEWCWTKYD